MARGSPFPGNDCCNDLLQVVTCHVFDAFDLFHVLILLCLKAARFGGENTRGGGVLPNMGYIGMCGPKEWGFSAVLLINRVSILAILVTNRLSSHK